MMLLVDKPCGKKELGYYGKAGDKVQMVVDYGDVLIVELNGNKFSVKKSDVQ